MKAAGHIRTPLLRLQARLLFARAEYGLPVGADSLLRLAHVPMELASAEERSDGER